MAGSEPRELQTEELALKVSDYLQHDQGYVCGPGFGVWVLNPKFTVVHHEQAKKQEGLLRSSVHLLTMTVLRESPCVFEQMRGCNQGGLEEEVIKWQENQCAETLN